MSTEQNTSPTSRTTHQDDHSDQIVSVRRAPSIPAFAITGGVIGLIVATLLTFIFTPPEMLTLDYSRSAVFGVLAVVIGAIGATVGIIIALILDRRSAKNPETLRAVETSDQ
ncbi:hypothetical protein [Rothia sp. ND6WE1A]|uniref:hypothetical protein n=1 Tax=Rothia sp. ND6WE1A TaxID=1848190 RepID=UPI0009F1A638|nr:hypothetical protein [Rothia sp. ND6WE1A]